MLGRLGLDVGLLQLHGRLLMLLGAWLMTQRLLRPLPRCQQGGHASERVCLHRCRPWGSRLVRHRVLQALLLLLLLLLLWQLIAHWLLLLLQLEGHLGVLGPGGPGQLGAVLGV